MREAIVTMLAAIATLLCALAIDPEPGPAILAVVLCLSLSRSHLDRDMKGRIEAAIVLPLVGILAVGVGMLLRHLPWIGALVFVTGITLSIWLRRFGLMACRAGSLIALPFVTLLTTPYVLTTKVGAVFAIFVPIIVALLALLWVSVFHALARLARLLPSARATVHAHAPSNAGSSLRPDAVTRMAIQMAVALSVSFVVGYAFFAERWAWIVLTAFIVGSGNRGRLDVAYKSVLRVLGASAGTAIALLFTVHLGSHDEATVVLMLTAIFLGTWLRPLGYAWWALFVTLALALLQGFTGSSPQYLLWLRLEEIVIGAIIGVTAAWLVLPVRSTAVLQRRIADALATLSDGLDPAKHARRSDDFITALARVEEVSPAFRASRRLTKTFQPVQPADWIDTLAACRDPAVAMIDAGQTPGSVRKAIGAARKSIREPGEFSKALDAILHSMARHSSTKESELAQSNE
ncbi:MAG: FUSC family protein [Dokdonella sp.]